MIFGGNSILVDDPAEFGANKPEADKVGTELISWIIGKVKPWEDLRDRAYRDLWGEYWRLWRGKWTEKDRNRDSERSRLIAPALSQAIDLTVSEISEAVFSKPVWFDVDDDIEEQQKGAAVAARDLLLEDTDKVNLPDEVDATVLNAAIFGTGIMKVNVLVAPEHKPSRDPVTKKMSAQQDDRVWVTAETVRPDQFIPDPAGTTISEMLGCAIKQQKPTHSVLEKIETGMYLDSALSALMPSERKDNNDVDDDDPASRLTLAETTNCTVLEYHGKVPLKLLAKVVSRKSELDDLLAEDDEKQTDGELVEAIVTIANESILLRAMANPFTMKDRSVIAFQFEKVPGRFWGRGVAEKGYNPQKALDSEIRARIDALGFISAPMLAIDAGRMAPGLKYEIRPGKVWITNGPPGEVLSPVKVGEIDAGTFNQAGDMERMVQMGTGAFDTASALGAQSQSGASAAGSNSVLMGAFVKRAKRAIRNVDRNLLSPLIQKILWRYMQFAPRRYPAAYSFNVKTTLGIVAREVESSQMTQLMGMMPQPFAPVTLRLALGIIENSALSNKADIMKAAEQALAPPPPEVAQQQQQLQQAQTAAQLAQAQGFLLDNQKKLAEIKKLLGEAQTQLQKGGFEQIKLQQEQQRIDNETKQVEQYQEQNHLALLSLVLQHKELGLKEKEIDVKRAAVNKPASSS